MLQRTCRALLGNAMKDAITKHILAAIDDLATEAKQHLREYAESAHPRNWQIKVVIAPRDNK